MHGVPDDLRKQVEDRIGKTAGYETLRHGRPRLDVCAMYYTRLYFLRDLSRLSIYVSSSRLTLLLHDVVATLHFQCCISA